MYQLWILASLLALSCSPSLVRSQWIPGRATVYGNAQGTNTFGACYGQLPVTSEFGSFTASASQFLFSNGSLNDCGACYQIRCVGTPYCKSSIPITVTVTNLCVDGNNSSTPRCSYPKTHFSLSQPAFTSISQLQAGSVRIEFQRVLCNRTGPVEVFIQGNAYFIIFSFSNVAQGGSLSRVWVKGNFDWVPASLSWGAQWYVSGQPDLKVASLSFILEDRLTGQNFTVFNAIPSNWTFQSTYTLGQFGSPSPPPSTVAPPPPPRGWILGASASFTGNNAGTNNYGACYGNITQSRVLGNFIAAASSSLFGNTADNECGSCYEIRCINNIYCKSFTKSVTVTIGNRCVRMMNGTSNRCDTRLQHFVLTRPAFGVIAQFKSGAIPIQYRRVVCSRTGSIQFFITGNRYWIVATILNVGGPGSLKAVSIKGTDTEWIPMKNSWGAYWRVSNRPELFGQALSFLLYSRLSNLNLTIPNVAPSNWTFNQTYSGGQFMSLY